MHERDAKGINNDRALNPINEPLIIGPIGAPRTFWNKLHVNPYQHVFTMQLLSNLTKV